METLISLFKSDFATVRQLEKEGFKLFAYAGGVFVLGLVMILTAVLAFIGIPLVMLGVVTFFLSMVWMTKQGRRPVWHLFCPYCSSKNDVFKTHPQFDCDMCGRPVVVNEHGEPSPTEPVETHTSY